MRVLHTSDWHLGKVLMEHSLLEDQRVALDGLAALLRDDRHDVLIVAGDVFDRSIPPEDAVTLLGQFLARVRADCPGMSVVIISGNHDSAARLAWGSELLALSNVHLCGEAERVDRPILITSNTGEEAEIWAVPFLWPGALASSERPTPTQTAALEVAIDRIHAAKKPGRAQILVAHCFAQGGRHSESERTLVGQATLAPISLFEGFDYVALGHLHRPQAVGSNARYSGSLLPYSFSEADDSKSVVSVDVRAGEAPRFELRTLPSLRRLRCLTAEFASLLHAPEYEPFHDDYLSITLTQAERSGQPMATLRKRFPYLLQLSNPVLKEVAVAARPGAARPTGTDLGADLRAFEASLHGEQVDHEVITAFDALCREQDGRAA